MKKKIKSHIKSENGNLQRQKMIGVWVNLGFERPQNGTNGLIACAISRGLKVFFPEKNRVQQLLIWIEANRPELISTQKDIVKPINKVIISKRLEKPNIDVKSEFYKSWDWRTLRMKALKINGARCQCCGADRNDIDMTGSPVRIVVDHIKPISKRWDLRLSLSNLQIMCDECNMGKGNWDDTDWRGLRTQR